MESEKRLVQKRWRQMEQTNQTKGQAQVSDPGCQPPAGRKRFDETIWEKEEPSGFGES